MPDAEMESDSRAAERLIFFSDAVVAIAITLLAIELPVPEGDTVKDFWSSAHSDAGHYAAFLISFVVIASAWSNHHDLFRYVRRVDARLRLMNTCWLLTIVLNPFATKLLTVAGHESLHAHALRFGFYALVQTLESAALFAMQRYMISHQLAPDIPAPLVTRMAWQELMPMLGFGLSIPVFFATFYGWVVWIVVPLLLTALRRRHRNHPRHHRNHSPEAL